jgi:tRNA(Arg) A34 adenosine deaminase TadA
MTDATDATDATVVTDVDLAWLRRCFELATEARARGDHPFGSLLVTADGRTVEAMNSVVTRRDPTGHAETNLVRVAAEVLPPEVLVTSTLYTSTEPCAMCAGAIYWSGIGRVVFALSEDALGRIVAAQEGVPTMSLPCREVFARGGRPIAVAGPADLPGAAAVHDGFWG